MNKFSVVLPTMWFGKYLFDMLKQLNDSEFVDEILLIDNGERSKPIDFNSKIRYIKNEENIYVNPSWNLGVHLAKNQNILILSDDVWFDVSYLKKIADHLVPGNIIGVAPSAWNAFTEFKLTVLNYRPHSWATAMFLRKDDWVDIPDTLKIWYGDDWIARHAKNLLGVEGINIKTDNETTSKRSIFNSVKRDDVREWYGTYLQQSNDFITQRLIEHKLFMNNCIFTTHHTLTKEHAHASLYSLFQPQTNIDLMWDNFIIYNTHPEEISDEWLVETVTSLDIYGQIKNLLVFPYQEGVYPKTLTQDTINHFKILTENGMNLPGKTLLLKSDYCVSNNFNEVFLEMTPINTIWSLPIHNAKEKVPMFDIYDKLKFSSFIYVDEVTYYRGGTNFPHTPGTMQNPYDEKTLLEEGTDETDPRILFVSHNIQNDYNLHVFTNDILNVCLQICERVYNPNSTWGGAHDLFNVAFQHAGIQKSSEIRAYGVHMYHGIISPNRKQDRTDPRKVIDGERY